MEQNSSSVIDRAGLAFYSLLISCMSAGKQGQDGTGQMSESSLLLPPDEAEGNTLFFEDSIGNPVRNRWSQISQVIVGLMTWMVLGFAAGYLIGMIYPR